MTSARDGRINGSLCKNVIQVIKFPNFSVGGFLFSGVSFINEVSIVFTYDKNIFNSPIQTRASVLGAKEKTLIDVLK